MKLTQAERLTIYMLADLHGKIGDGDRDYQLVKDAILTGNEWSLPIELHGILHGEVVPDNLAHEVFNMLSALSRLEVAYQALSETEKAEFDAKVPRHSGGQFFTGFDGNHEGQHFSAAKFIMKKMNRYGEFAGRDLNSHTPRVSSYRDVVSKLNSCSSDPIELDDLVSILA